MPPASQWWTDGRQPEGEVFQQDVDFEEKWADFKFWDELIRLVFKGYGGDPYPPYYRWVTSEELAATMPYIGMPVFPSAWFNGKNFVQYMRQFRAGEVHVPYEMILNTDPAWVYMREANTMPLNVLIIAHAACGHSHFFKHNASTRQAGAATILERMASWAKRCEDLENDPDFGVERLEYTLDAAMVLARYGTELNKSRVPEPQLRRRLERELRDLESRKRELGGGFEADSLDGRIELIRKRLSRDPINRVRDIGSFILNPDHNPGLSVEERDIILIAFEIERYFNGQQETKFMNEGFASWCHERLLKDVQTCLPAGFQMELLYFWTQFDRSPIAKYMDPYVLTLFLLKELEEELCHEQDEDVPILVPVFRKVRDWHSEEAKRESIHRPARRRKREPPALPLDRSRIARDEKGNILLFTGKWRETTTRRRDIRPLLDIIERHRDTSFFREYLTFKRIEKLNDTSLDWVNEQFRLINSELRRLDWGPNAVVDPVPLSLEGKLEAVRKWMALAQLSAAAHLTKGGPLFPGVPRNLQFMATILQIVAGYHADKERFRQGMLMRLSVVHAFPDIAVVDGGKDSANAGTLTLEHIFDPITGFLLQSWARESLKLLPRIWKGAGGVKLLTQEGEVTKEGELKEQYEYYYTVDREGNVKDAPVHPRPVVAKVEDHPYEDFYF